MITDHAVLEVDGREADRYVHFNRRATGDGGCLFICWGKCVAHATAATAWGQLLKLTQAVTAVTRAWHRRSCTTAQPRRPTSTSLEPVPTTTRSTTVNEWWMLAGTT